MTDIPSPEERFHHVVIDMTQLVYDLVNEADQRGHKIIKPNLVSMCGAFLNGYDKTKLIQTFIDYSHMNWDQVCDNNEEFFIKNAGSIFKDLPMNGANNVEPFKLLFTMVDDKNKPVIGVDDRKLLWEYFEAMVRICIKYIHANRKPLIKILESGEKRLAYSMKFFPYVQLEHHSKKWDVQLEFTSRA